MVSENIVEFTDGTFETDVLRSEQPVLVDFWAEWCMPCIMLAPVVEELASEYAGKMKFGKVDVGAETNIPLANKFDVQSIPTLIVFKDGQVVKKLIGRQDKSILKSAIDEVLV